MPEGQVLSLEWKQVDFLANVIRLGAGTTKNDEGRGVPFVLQLRTLLLEQRARRQPGCPFVCFRLDRRGQPAELKRFRKAWQSACVRAGLGKMVPTGETAKRADRRHGCPNLRRSAVRSLVRSGVPDRARSLAGYWPDEPSVTPHGVSKTGDLARLQHLRMPVKCPQNFGR